MRDWDWVSIHAPREGRDSAAGAASPALASFQSTRPVKGATRTPETGGQPSAWFQSTRPVKGATVRVVRHRNGGRVSIHAPREGRDTTAFSNRAPANGFNPRAP